MKSLNLLKVIFPVLAVASLACGTTTTTDGGTTGHPTTAGNTNAGNNGGSTSSGGGSTGGGNTGGGSSSGGTTGCVLPAQPTGDVCLLASVDAGPIELPDAGGFGDGGGVIDGGVVPSQLGASCSLTSATDSCASVGLECTGNPNAAATSTTGYCDFPTEYGACLATVGCYAPDTCIDTSAIFKGGGLQCLQVCKASTDCVDTFDACLQVSATQSLCITNICGPEAKALSGVANGTGYFQPCNANATNDGTCVPAVFAGANTDGGNLLGGVCQPDGTAAVGATCGQERSATGAPQCVAGSTCLGVSTTEAQCFPLCTVDTAATDACGPTCATGSGCLPVGGLDVGVCAENCTSSSSCTAPLTCLNPQG